MSDGRRITVDHTHRRDLYSAARPSKINGLIMMPAAETHFCFSQKPKSLLQSRQSSTSRWILPSLLYLKWQGIQNMDALPCEHCSSDRSPGAKTMPRQPVVAARSAEDQLQKVRTTSKFCAMTTTTECSSWVVQTGMKQIQDGGRPPSWKTEKRPCVHNGLTKWCWLLLF